MKTKIGTYTGTGTRFDLDLGEGKHPDLIIIAGEAAAAVATWIPDNWVSRANGLSQVDSFLNGIQGYGKGVSIGTAANVNTSGVKYYWAALWADGARDFEFTSHMGNATAGRVIDLSIKKSVLATLIKRDSTRQAVAQVGTKPTAFLGGGTPANCVTLGSGQLTLTAQNEVNEYNSAGGLGEGITSYSFFDSRDCKIVSWSGTPASGTVVPVSGDPLFALIFSTAGSALVGRFITRDMPTEDNATKLLDATALSSNEAALVQSGIRLGSSSNLRPAGEVTALVFCRSESIPKHSPAIIVRGKKGIYFPGRGTAALVDCGASDSLSLTEGPYSISWTGIIRPTASAINADLTFITRGIGPAATANAYSWGLGAMHKPDGGWSGPQIIGIVSGQFNDAAPLDSAVWRTGVLPPFNKPFNVIETYDGAGGWKLYLNGKLMQQRAMSTPPNPTQTVGHRTVMGGRPNGVGAYTNYQRMIAMGARLYSRVLSQDESESIYAHDLLGSGADVESGLVEAWNFDGASGLVLPARVASGNNGTLTGGAVIVTL